MKKQVRNLRQRLSDFFRENTAYKIASLAIAVLLWMILSSRREFEVIKNFGLEYRVSDSMLVQTTSVPQVKVHLFGPRSSLKKVMDGSWNNTIVVEAFNLAPGKQRVRIDRSRIELPFGVKAIAVQPTVIEFELKARPGVGSN